jgi:NADH dehydrogenase
MAAPIGLDDYKTNYEVTVKGTKNLIEACIINNVKRIVFLSSVMASIKESSYGKTKLMAEKILLNSGLDVTVLRADWIYGEGDWGLSKLLRLIAKCPFIPVPGDGNYKKKPIFIKDVVSAIVRCLQNNKGRLYMLGGPSLTFNEMLKTLCNVLGIRKQVLHLPLYFFSVARGFQGVTKNNILGLTYNCEYDTSLTEKDLVKPIRFEEGLLKCRNYYKSVMHDTMVA